MRDPAVNINASIEAKGSVAYKVFYNSAEKSPLNINVSPISVGLDESAKNIFTSYDLGSGEQPVPYISKITDVELLNNAIMRFTVDAQGGIAYLPRERINRESLAIINDWLSEPAGLENPPEDPQVSVTTTALTAVTLPGTDYDLFETGNYQFLTRRNNLTGSDEVIGLAGAPGSQFSFNSQNGPVRFLGGLWTGGTIEIGTQGQIIPHENVSGIQIPFSSYNPAGSLLYRLPFGLRVNLQFYQGIDATVRVNIGELAFKADAWRYDAEEEPSLDLVGEPGENKIDTVVSAGDPYMSNIVLETLPLTGARAGEESHRLILQGTGGKILWSNAIGSTEQEGDISLSQELTLSKDNIISPFQGDMISVDATEGLLEFGSTGNAFSPLMLNPGAQGTLRGFSSDNILDRGQIGFYSQGGRDANFKIDELGSWKFPSGALAWMRYKQGRHQLSLSQDTAFFESIQQSQEGSLTLTKDLDYKFEADTWQLGKIGKETFDASKDNAIPSGVIDLDIKIERQGKTVAQVSDQGLAWDSEQKALRASLDSTNMDIGVLYPDLSSTEESVSAVNEANLATQEDISSYRTVATILGNALDGKYAEFRLSDTQSKQLPIHPVSGKLPTFIHATPSGFVNSIPALGTVKGSRINIAEGVALVLNERDALDTNAYAYNAYQQTMQRGTQGGGWDINLEGGLRLHRFTQIKDIYSQLRVENPEQKFTAQTLGITKTVIEEGRFDIEATSNLGKLFTRHPGRDWSDAHRVDDSLFVDANNILYLTARERNFDNAFRLNLNPETTAGQPTQFSKNDTELYIKRTDKRTGTVQGQEHLIFATGDLDLALQISPEVASLTSLHLYDGATYHIAPLNHFSRQDGVHNVTPSPGGFVSIAGEKVYSGGFTLRDGGIEFLDDTLLLRSMSLNLEAKGKKGLLGYDTAEVIWQTQANGHVLMQIRDGQLHIIPDTYKMDGEVTSIARYKEAVKTGDITEQQIAELELLEEEFHRPRLERDWSKMTEQERQERNRRVEQEKISYAKRRAEILNIPNSYIDHELTETARVEKLRFDQDVPILTAEGKTFDISSLFGDEGRLPTTNTDNAERRLIDTETNVVGKPVGRPSLGLVQLEGRLEWQIGKLEGEDTFTMSPMFESPGAKQSITFPGGAQFTLMGRKSATETGTGVSIDFEFSRQGIEPTITEGSYAFVNPTRVGSNEYGFVYRSDKRGTTFMGLDIRPFLRGTPEAGARVGDYLKGVDKDKVAPQTEQKNRSLISITSGETSNDDYNKFFHNGWKFDASDLERRPDKGFIGETIRFVHNPAHIGVMVVYTDEQGYPQTLHYADNQRMMDPLLTYLLAQAEGKSILDFTNIGNMTYDSWKMLSEYKHTLGDLQLEKNKVAGPFYMGFLVTSAVGLGALLAPVGSGAGATASSVSSSILSRLTSSPMRAIGQRVLAPTLSRTALANFAARHPIATAFLAYYTASTAYSIVDDGIIAPSVNQYRPSSSPFLALMQNISKAGGRQVVRALGHGPLRPFGDKVAALDRIETEYILGSFNQHLGPISAIPSFAFGTTKFYLSTPGLVLNTFSHPYQTLQSFAGMVRLPMELIQGGGKDIMPANAAEWGYLFGGLFGAGRSFREMGAGVKTFARTRYLDKAKGSFVIVGKTDSLGLPVVGGGLTRTGKLIDTMGAAFYTSPTYLKITAGLSLGVPLASGVVQGQGLDLLGRSAKNLTYNLDSVVSSSFGISLGFRMLGAAVGSTGKAFNSSRLGQWASQGTWSSRLLRPGAVGLGVSSIGAGMYGLGAFTPGLKGTTTGNIIASFGLITFGAGHRYGSGYSSGRRSKGRG